MKNNKMQIKDARNIFFTGLIVLIPIAATFFTIVWLFNVVDSFFRDPLQKILGFRIVGIGVILTLVIVFWTGLFATNYLGRKIIDFLEKSICKVPLVSMIYSSIKQIINTVFTEKNNNFKSAVAIEYPSKGIYTIGFLTADAPRVITDITNEKMKSIFVPTTPNPTSGMFVMIAEKDIVYLGLSVDAAIKLIVSGGIITPDIIQDENRDT
ncbi:DUF502 domain-containing protein [Anaeromicrobium sediminis]|uniref:DUF502 domain-containing protein n=1 Tax=Anaeromicrobium sediminis TaxID=1478221 RepID=A0A267MJG6_9FIRM|nr:DUF502 domain-containing protein [Anaeromicrobium sediminis]PAB58923.1 hypothetical protein CCE28_12120 [Anaeromicrobium sediminis]